MNDDSRRLTPVVYHTTRCSQISPQKERRKTKKNKKDVVRRWLSTGKLHVADDNRKMCWNTDARNDAVCCSQISPKNDENKRTRKHENTSSSVISRSRENVTLTTAMCPGVWASTMMQSAPLTNIPQKGKGKIKGKKKNGASSSPWFCPPDNLT